MIRLSHFSGSSIPEVCRLRVGTKGEAYGVLVAMTINSVFISTTVRHGFPERFMLEDRSVEVRFVVDAQLVHHVFEHQGSFRVLLVGGLQDGDRFGDFPSGGCGEGLPCLYSATGEDRGEAVTDAASFRCDQVSVAGLATIANATSDRPSAQALKDQVHMFSQANVLCQY